MDEHAKHYLTKVTDMPPTAVECKCGVIIDGPECLRRISDHIREGNRD